MSEYADVNEIVKILTNNQTYSATVIQAIIDRIPKADVEPVRHGHWIVGMDFSDGTGAFICSLCGHAEKWNEPYCNCGAKMDGKENEK